VTPLALRWTVVTVTGQAVNRPCRLYYARLAATTSGAQVATAVLHDDGTANQAGPPLLALMTTTNTGPDDWPRIPVSLNFQKGIDVVMVGSNVGLFLGWETS